MTCAFDLTTVERAELTRLRDTVSRRASKITLATLVQFSKICARRTRRQRGAMS